MSQHLSKLLILVSIIIAAVVLEINEKPTGGLWFLIVIWIIFDTWDGK